MIKPILLVLLTTLSFQLNASQEGSTFGDSMPDAPPPITLQSAIAMLEAGEPVTGIKISGQITEVCAKKGCWMVLTDGAVYARVRFLDYGFFVPVDSATRDAVVLGTLTRTELTKKEAAHYEADAGRDSAGATATAEYAITASAVVIEPFTESGA